MRDALPELDWKNHALFLDFDGTLAPIVMRPEQAAVSCETRHAIGLILEKTGGALAVLSGRDLSDLDRRLAPLELPAAGSHGVVRRDAKGTLRRSAASRELLMTAADRLETFARERDLLIERKFGAVTIHYRNHPEAAGRAKALVDEIAESVEGLRAMHGDMVSELAVPAANKGHALEAFMDEPPFAGRVPVAAGDDTTDEDAFEAAQRLGGVGVKIGAGATVANTRAPAIETFLDWLHRAAEG